MEHDYKIKFLLQFFPPAGSCLCVKHVTVSMRSTCTSAMNVLLMLPTLDMFVDKSTSKRAGSLQPEYQSCLSQLRKIIPASTLWNVLESIQMFSTLASYPLNKFSLWNCLVGICSWHTSHSFSISKLHSDSLKIPNHSFSCGSFSFLSLAYPDALVSSNHLFF
jgi:hypothetical protein